MVEVLTPRPTPIARNVVEVGLMMMMIIMVVVIVMMMVIIMMMMNIVKIHAIR